MKLENVRSTWRTWCKIIRFSAKSDKNRLKILLLGTFTGILREGAVLARTFFPATILNLVIYREQISRPLIAACGISILLSAIDFLIEAQMQKISNLSVSSISYKVLALNKKYMSMRFDKACTAEAYSRYDRATDAVWEINDTEYILYANLLPKAFSLFGLVSVFLNVDILAAAVLFISALIDLYIGGKHEDAELNAREEISQAEHKFTYTMSNLLEPTYSRDLQAYDSVSIFSKRIETYRKRYIGLIKKREIKKLIVELFSELNSFIRLALVYILALFSFFSGRLQIGNFLLYINASDTFVSTMYQIKNSVLFFKRVISYYSDIEAFDNCGNKSVEENFSHIIDKTFPIIELQNVSFTYPGQSKKAIDCVSLKIYEHEKYALVGENGSGKTTLVKLILKLYRPDEGKILLFGKDINEIPDEEYFTQFSPVFQDYQLLAYTLRENIAFGDNNVSRIMDVLSDVKFTDKISKLPRGVDTYYTTRFDDNGVEFSGGEQQLLVIARALYKSSPVFLIDEPTAAIDPKREREIFDLFSDNTKCSTVVYISHRMSASRLADKIFLLKDGRIIESGTHKSLIEKHGGYFELWNMQAQWYL